MFFISSGQKGPEPPSPLRPPRAGRRVVDRVEAGDDAARVVERLVLLHVEEARLDERRVAVVSVCKSSSGPGAIVASMA